MGKFFYFSPLSLNPFPPKGAREVVAPQSIPAPSGGRMSEGQKGGYFKYRLLQFSLLREKLFSGSPKKLSFHLSGNKKKAVLNSYHLFAREPGAKVVIGDLADIARAAAEARDTGDRVCR